MEWWKEATDPFFKCYKVYFLSGELGRTALFAPFCISLVKTQFHQSFPFHTNVQQEYIREYCAYLKWPSTWYHHIQCCSAKRPKLHTAGNVYLCKSAACTAACMYNMLIYMLWLPVPVCCICRCCVYTSVYLHVLLAFSLNGTVWRRNGKTNGRNVWDSWGRCRKVPESKLWYRHKS